MTRETVNVAVAEAERFLARAHALLIVDNQTEPADRSVYYGSKETGALRRASMDLTRALADLRKYS